MIRLGLLFGLLGLVAATGVIVWTGADQVLRALSVAGWGIVWSSLFHLVPMIVCVLGWQALLPGKVKAASRAFMLYVLWLRASVNNLMPVARIGGEIVSVRVMVKAGLRKGPAIASTVVETTTSVLAQFVFVLVGIAFFVLRFTEADITAKLLWGVLFSAPALGGLVLVQKIGFFGLLDKVFGSLFRDTWKKFAGGGARLDRAVRVMYRRGRTVFFCFAMQLASWALCGVELWIALRYLGHPLSLAECLMLEALIQAASSAAFVVPGALGVQEAGFLLFGQMLGLPRDVALALALVRRCRDLILYVPGLILWQLQEGHWLAQRRKKTRTPRTVS